MYSRDRNILHVLHVFEACQQPSSSVSEFLTEIFNQTIFPADVTFTKLLKKFIEI